MNLLCVWVCVRVYSICIYMYTHTYIEMAAWIVKQKNQKLLHCHNRFEEVGCAQAALRQADKWKLLRRRTRGRAAAETDLTLALPGLALLARTQKGLLCLNTEPLLCRCFITLLSGKNVTAFPPATTERGCDTTRDGGDVKVGRDL